MASQEMKAIGLLDAKTDPRGSAGGGLRSRLPGRGPVVIQAGRVIEDVVAGTVVFEAGNPFTSGDTASVLIAPNALKTTSWAFVFPYMTILAIVDSREPDQVINPRDQKLEIIKQRCLQAAQVKYICVYPPQLPRYRELREQILGPAADLV